MNLSRLLVIESSPCMLAKGMILSSTSSLLHFDWFIIDYLLIFLGRNFKFISKMLISQLIAFSTLPQICSFFSMYFNKGLSFSKQVTFSSHLYVVLPNIVCVLLIPHIVQFSSYLKRVFLQEYPSGTMFLLIYT